MMLLCFVNCPVLTPRASLLHTGTLSRSSSLCRSGTLSRILLLLIAHTCTLSRCSSSLPIRYALTDPRARILLLLALILAFVFFFFSLWTGTLSRSSLPWRSGTLSRILLRCSVHSHEPSSTTRGSLTRSFVNTFDASSSFSSLSACSRSLLRLQSAPSRSSSRSSPNSYSS